MLKQYKKQMMFATLVTLLPMALGLVLRTAAPWIWNIGMGSPNPLPTILLWMPLMLTLLLWVTAWVTARDNQGKNRKVFSLVLWMIPVISNLCIAVTYCAVLGADFPVASVMLMVLGLLFTVIGNFLPKTRRNGTIGIKVIWTLASDENWNATHRFAGPVWMLGGIVMMLCACLPQKIGIPLFIADLLLFTAAPIHYSWRYYKKQCKAGTAPDLKLVKSKFSKWQLLIMAGILVFVCVIMFMGNIEFTFHQDDFTIASFYDHDVTVSYDTIEAVEYRELENRGCRTAGFGSAKLMMGLFENDEFGRYTRYSYVSCKSAVVLKLKNDAVMVINGNSDAETRDLYNELVKRVGQP